MNTNTKARNYEKKNPRKAELIRKAVKKGMKEYVETFRRLATS
jgi:hypothetical protein